MHVDVAPDGLPLERSRAEGRVELVEIEHPGDGHGAASFSRRFWHTAPTLIQNSHRHDAEWLVELTAAANYFAFLSGIVNAFEVPAPPDGDKLPA
jgi:hypothetical protein